MRDFGTKTDNTAPSASGILTAAEDNVRFLELKQACTSAGITLDGASGPDTSTTMLSEAMARYASGGVFAVDTGAANAYVLGGSNDFEMPSALFKGLTVLFYPGAGNTTTATINAFGIGSKPLWDHTGTPLVGAEMVANRLVEALYDPALNTGSGAWKLAPWANALLYSGGGGGGGGGWAGWLEPCRVATSANITLSGAQTIDGVAVIAGDRVLVNAQTSGAQNGPYVCASGAWSRTTDFDSNGESKAGVSVVVTEGTSYADTLWELATDNTITLGTTALKWVTGEKAFGFYGSASGIAIAALTFTVVSPSGATGALGSSSYTNGVFTCGANEPGWWSFTLNISYTPGSTVANFDRIVARIAGPHSAVQQQNVQGSGNQGNPASVCLIEKLAAGDTVTFTAFHDKAGTIDAIYTAARIGR